MTAFFICKSCGFRFVSSEKQSYCVDCDPDTPKKYKSLIVRGKHGISTTHACEGGEI